MQSFHDKFSNFLGSTIIEVQVLNSLSLAQLFRWDFLSQGSHSAFM